jgi:hypothetical protein
MWKIHIETTVLWKGGKDKALSGQKNELIDAIGKAFRRHFGKFTGLVVTNRMRGATFQLLALYEGNEAIRVSYQNSGSPVSRNSKKELVAEFTISIDMSAMDDGIREAFLSVLFQFLTHGRGVMGRETNLFQERLVVNGKFIRLPDHVREDVDEQKVVFMQAVLF